MKSVGLQVLYTHNEGMLIDLNLAKELYSGPNEARHQTRIMEFIAIELHTRGHIPYIDLPTFPIVVYLL